MSIEKEKNIFFRNVKRFRERQGKSMQELAEESSVPIYMLEQLEQNRLPTEMMVDDAYKLAVAFHFKITELFHE